MSIPYLKEHAENAALALKLAEREVEHLGYTYRTLYATPIDLEWVGQLPQREDLSEKIDAFVGRFSRLQDHIGEKLLPHFARLMGGQPRTLLDTLAYAERMEWVDSAEDFIAARKLRNLLVHEYMEEAELFLEALQSANEATLMLLGVVKRIRDHADMVGLAE